MSTKQRITFNDNVKRRVPKMDYTIQEEAQKVIQLRDSIFNDKESYNDAEFIRLKIEKKLRDEAERTKDYGKYLKSGRVDLIDEKRRNQLVTPISDLQAAYYENYKSRKDREAESHDQARSSQRTSTLESFYDEDGDQIPKPTKDNTQQFTSQGTMANQTISPMAPSPLLQNPPPQFQQQKFIKGMINVPYFNPIPQQNSSSPPLPWSYEHQLQILQNQARAQNPQQMNTAPPTPFPFMPMFPQNNHVFPGYQQFPQFNQQQQQPINYGDSAGNLETATNQQQQQLPQGRSRTLQPY